MENRTKIEKKPKVFKADFPLGLVKKDIRYNRDDLKIFQFEVSVDGNLTANYKDIKLTLIERRFKK